MKPNLQPSLFKYDWIEAKGRGVSKIQAIKLYNLKMLSFNPNQVKELEEYEMVELFFLKTLFFDSGLPEQIVTAMLSEIEKPYSYSFDQIYWDFTKNEWVYFLEQEEVEIEDLIEQLEEDEDYERLKEVKTKIMQILKDNPDTQA